MNKTLVFDTGPLITLTLNNLLWAIKPLKNALKGEFKICPAVYQELIKKPLTTKKYKFEALQVLPFIMDETLEIFHNKELSKKADDLLELANKSFIAKDNYINVVHRGEMEAIATALETGAKTLVIDERTTRTLIENPYALSDHLSKKLHTNIEINRDNLSQLSKQINGINVIRSFELGFVAYELGILDRYVIKSEEKLKEIENIQNAVLEGVLWAIKLSGCSVAGEDIEKILKMKSLSHP
ncbi:MAG: hypothetical protein ACOCZ6_04255 [Nanoarchaeota archaeon]